MFLRRGDSPGSKGSGGSVSPRERAASSAARALDLVKKLGQGDTIVRDGEVYKKKKYEKAYPSEPTDIPGFNAMQRAVLIELLGEVEKKIVSGKYQPWMLVNLIQNEAFKSYFKEPAIGMILVQLVSLQNANAPSGDSTKNLIPGVPEKEQVHTVYQALKQNVETRNFDKEKLPRAVKHYLAINRVLKAVPHTGLRLYILNNLTLEGLDEAKLKTFSSKATALLSQYSASKKTTKDISTTVAALNKLIRTLGNPKLPAEHADLDLMLHLGTPTDQDNTISGFVFDVVNKFSTQNGDGKFELNVSVNIDLLKDFRGQMGDFGIQDGLTGTVLSSSKDVPFVKDVTTVVHQLSSAIRSHCRDDMMRRDAEAKAKEESAKVDPELHREPLRVSA